MSHHDAPSNHEDIEYFRVLARARQLMPAARALLDHAALVDPDRMSEAALACGLTPEWVKYDPEDDSHFERWIGAIAGEVHVLGFSWRSPALQVIRTPANSREGAHLALDVTYDVTVMGIDAPTIGLIHHEGICALIECPTPAGAPEDPRALARQLARKALRGRDAALERLLPPVRERLLEILLDRRHMAAIKHLREELGCSLVSATEFVRAADPWWPPGIALADAAS